MRLTYNPLGFLSMGWSKPLNDVYRVATASTVKLSEGPQKKSPLFHIIRSFLFLLTCCDSSHRSSHKCFFFLNNPKPGPDLAARSHVFTDFRGTEVGRLPLSGVMRTWVCVSGLPSRTWRPGFPRAMLTSPGPGRPSLTAGSLE